MGCEQSIENVEEINTHAFIYEMDVAVAFFSIGKEVLKRTLFQVSVDFLECKIFFDSLQEIIREDYVSELRRLPPSADKIINRLSNICKQKYLKTDIKTAVHTVWLELTNNLDKIRKLCRAKVYCVKDVRYENCVSSVCKNIYHNCLFYRMSSSLPIIRANFLLFLKRVFDASTYLGGKSWEKEFQRILSVFSNDKQKIDYCVLFGEMTFSEFMLPPPYDKDFSRIIVAYAGPNPTYDLIARRILKFCSTVTP